MKDSLVFHFAYVQVDPDVYVGPSLCRWPTLFHRPQKPVRCPFYLVVNVHLSLVWWSISPCYLVNTLGHNPFFESTLTPAHPRRQTPAAQGPFRLVVLFPNQTPLWWLTDIWLRKDPHVGRVCRHTDKGIVTKTYICTEPNSCFGDKDKVKLTQKVFTTDTPLRSG